LFLTRGLVPEAKLVNKWTEAVQDLVSAENKPLAAKTEDAEAKAILIPLIASVSVGLTAFCAPCHALGVSDGGSRFERSGTEGDHS
jgi:diacylglycerol kinase